MQDIVEQGAAAGLQGTSGGRLEPSEVHRVDAIRHTEVRAAFAVSRAAGRRVHGHDQRFVSGGLGAAHQFQREAAVVLDVELQPQGAAVRVIMDGLGDLLQRHAGLGAQNQAGLLCRCGIGRSEFTIRMHHLLVSHRGQQHRPGEGAPQQLGAGMTTGQCTQDARVEPQGRPGCLVGLQGVFVGGATVEVGPGRFGQAFPGMALVITQRDDITRNGRGVHVSAHMRNRL